MEPSAITNLGATLTRNEVFKVLRVGRTKGYELLKRADFPLAVDLSGNGGGTSHVYITAEIFAWLAKQPRRNVGAEPEPLAASRRQYRMGKLVPAKKDPRRHDRKVKESARLATAFADKAGA
jgi:predicted DNA-binding transcriptional regulator AlpA